MPSNMLPPNPKADIGLALLSPEDATLNCVMTAIAATMSKINAATPPIDEPTMTAVLAPACAVSSNVQLPSNDASTEFGPSGDGVGGSGDGGSVEGVGGYGTSGGDGTGGGVIVGDVGRVVVELEANEWFIEWFMVVLGPKSSSDSDGGLRVPPPQAQQSCSAIKVGVS